MIQLVAVGAALASSAAAGTSSVLQHHSARREHEAGRASGSWIGRLVTRPLWLMGLAAAVVGLVLHAWALHAGQLAVVQPLLVCGLLFALPASVLLERRRPQLGQWLEAVVLVAALAAFLLLSWPSGGQASADSGRLAIVCLTGAPVIAMLASSSRLLGGKSTAPLLASGGGFAFALSAALLKQVLAEGTHGGISGVISWPTWALVGMGGLGLLLTQLAYRAGPLSASLPALTITDPAASIVIGVAAFGERLAHSPSRMVAEALAFLVMTGCAARLARCTS